MKFFGLLLIVSMVYLEADARGAELDWTRFNGTVKAVNLKAGSITIQNAEGDLFTVPVDYQVIIVVGKGKTAATKILKDVTLDDKVTLIRTPADKPVEDNEGLVPYRGMK